MRRRIRTASREAITMETMNWSWVGLLALGAFHGVNPGMGWLFAVALGMQERRRAAVWRAMLPLALGHALAIAAARRQSRCCSVPWCRCARFSGQSAACCWRWASRDSSGMSHPRWVGMQVGLKDLDRLVVPDGLRAWRRLDGVAARAGRAAATACTHHMMHGAVAGAVVGRVGDRAPQRRLSCRQCADRVDRVRKARRRTAAQGLDQSRSGLGGRAGRHEPRHVRDGVKSRPLPSIPLASARAIGSND